MGFFIKKNSINMEEIITATVSNEGGIFPYNKIFNFKEGEIRVTNGKNVFLMNSKNIFKVRIYNKKKTLFILFPNHTKDNEFKINAVLEGDYKISISNWKLKKIPPKGIIDFFDAKYSSKRILKIIITVNIIFPQIKGLIFNEKEGETITFVKDVKEFEYFAEIVIDSFKIYGKCSIRCFSNDNSFFEFKTNELKAKADTIIILPYFNIQTGPKKIFPMGGSIIAFNVIKNSFLKSEVDFLISGVKSSYFKFLAGNQSIGIAIPPLNNKLYENILPEIDLTNNNNIEIFTSNPIGNNNNKLIDYNISTYFEHNNDTCFIGFTTKEKGFYMSIKAIKILFEPSQTSKESLKGGNIYFPNYGIDEFISAENMQVPGWNDFYFTSPQEHKSILYRVVNEPTKKIKNTCKISEIRIYGKIINRNPKFQVFMIYRKKIIQKQIFSFNVPTIQQLKMTKSSYLALPNQKNLEINIDSFSYNLSLYKINLYYVLINSKIKIRANMINNGKGIKFQYNPKLHNITSITPEIVIGELGFAQIDPDFIIYFYEKWDNYTFWHKKKKILPVENLDILISSNEVILLNCDTEILKSLIIEGVLIFEDTKEITLKAKSIIIRKNGKLLIGSKSESHKSKVNIIMYGKKEIIVKDNGTCIIHGKKRGKIWRKITKNINNFTFQLNEAIQNWNANSEVIITFKREDSLFKNQRNIIKRINNNIIELVNPVEYNDNILGEIGLLTSDIKIYGIFYLNIFIFYSF